VRSPWSALVLAALISGAPASGAQSNPVLEHYRAYRAALDQGDLTRAQSEASLALDASEARDGDTGNTAALALNLATTRLLVGDAQGARGPAQQALTLARAGATGVDVRLATLTLGRAELAAQDRSGANLLRPLMSGADLSGLPDEDLYAAADEFGLWSFKQQDFTDAHTAFDLARVHASGSRFGEAYGAGRAMTWSTAALFLRQLQLRQNEIGLTMARQVWRQFDDAIRTLRPLAEADAAGTEVTISQLAYAEALAWRTVLDAKLSQQDLSLPEWRDASAAEHSGDGFTDMQAPSSPIPRCLFTLGRTPLPAYPEQENNAEVVGAVVLRMQTDEVGQVIERAVIAHVGDDAFAHAVEQVVSRWGLTVRQDSPPHCRKAVTLYVPIDFVPG
jgi:hypothetical protein